MGTALEHLQSEIEIFNKNLPDWVYHRCKKNIKPIASPKDEAIKDLYIAPFHSQWRKYIAIDIDHENWYEATHDNDLIPNIVIKNKNNNKAHLLYENLLVCLKNLCPTNSRQFYKVNDIYCCLCSG